MHNSTLKSVSEYRFSRELRLLAPSDFTPVFNNPIVASCPAFTILAIKTDIEHPRLGLTIAKKRVKKANARNRLKRLIRESFRHKQHQLPNIDIVVMAKNGADKLDNEVLAKHLEKLWRKIIQRCKDA